jgi:hypothetical protein
MTQTAAIKLLNAATTTGDGAVFNLAFPQLAAAVQMEVTGKGIANEGQQQRALDYIVRVLCETDRMTFWPGGEDGRRSTDFAEGKRWVGVQLRRIEKLRPQHPGATAEAG